VTYVFTFLGEFGYELFNWQGVVRKFARTLGPSDRVVCCGRPGLSLLYESAALYVDVSEVELYRRSIACGYFARDPEADNHMASVANRTFDRRLREQLVAFILGRMRADPSWQPPEAAWRRWVRRAAPSLFGGCRFVFSSDKTPLGGCVFGADRHLYGNDPDEGNIYGPKVVENNLFRKVEPDPRVREWVEKQLGWSLGEPFILCQNRARSLAQPSQDRIPNKRLLESIGARTRVLLLSFDTGRHLDSYSAFAGMPGCSRYPCKSLEEQACLIAHARHCVFFTEGDFGSHIYVPPFMGKDVTAIASRSVYEIGTTPIDMWNECVFCFGGRIIPKVSEEVFSSVETVASCADEILAR
jgi:hypothetical protein